MSRDINDIYKKIDQSHKELYEQENHIEKDLGEIANNQGKILQDIAEIKKQVKDIGFKVELMLQILNNFTVMLAEEDDGDEEDYNDNDWSSEESEDLDDYENNDWSNGEDES